MRAARLPIALLSITLLGSGCSRLREKGAKGETLTGPSAPEAISSAPPVEPPRPGIIEGARTARIGEPAPDFSLPDLSGNDVRLSDYQGKVIVLEWFNPECPFVNLSHTEGSLKGAAASKAASGVVWLSINSAAPGRQGHDKQQNEMAKVRFGLSHPMLFDEAGEVGRAYGATRTPEMFVIDKKGVLVYAGAIDNSPDGEGKSPVGGTFINYVEAVLEDLGAERPVRTPRTEAYGCSVKYGSP